MEEGSEKLELQGGRLLEVLQKMRENDMMCATIVSTYRRNIKVLSIPRVYPGCLSTFYLPIIVV